MREQLIENIEELEAEASQPAYATEIPPQSAFTRISRSIRLRGLLRTFGICLGALICKIFGGRAGSMLQQHVGIWQGRRFDRRHRVRTSDAISIKTLSVIGTQQECGSAYLAVRPAVLSELFQFLRIDHQRFSFIDYGSGMGRVLLWASAHPFRQVLGVEFSPELHAIAQQNIKDFHNPRQRCFSIRSECASAEDFPLPDGDLVLFFNNPFGPPVMKLVLERLERSLASRYRQVWILYYRPKCEFLFAAAPFLQKVGESLTANYYWYSVYRTRPDGGAPGSAVI